MSQQYHESDKRARCVIVAAAAIEDYDRIRTFLREDDYFIFADAALRHSDSLAVKPDLIVGDFDSYSGDVDADYSGVEIIRLPCEKDDTDTFFAVKEGMRRGFRDFILIGVVAGRIDHSLANISALVMLAEKGLSAVAVDDYSQMWVVLGGQSAEVSDCEYFSLISLTEKCKGVYITGARYPLSDGCITASFQYAISNEVLLSQKARISLRDGIMLVIITDNIR